MYRSILLSTSLAYALFGLAPANAESDPEIQDARSQTYFIMNQRGDEFLRELGRDMGVLIQNSDGVRTRIRRVHLSGTTSEILDQLASQFDLNWFQYNNAYYVSLKLEAITRIIRLGNLEHEDAITALEESSIDLGRLSLSAVAGDSALSVTGPPRLIAIVESIIEGIPEEKVEDDKRTILVRRGTEVTQEAIR